MKKVSKQREYAAMLRSQHSTMRKQEVGKGSTQLPAKPKHVIEAEIKRQTVSEAACTCMIMISSVQRNTVLFNYGKCCTWGISEIYMGY